MSDISTRLTSLAACFKLIHQKTVETIESELKSNISMVFFEEYRTLRSSQV